MALSSTQNTRNTIANVASQGVLPYLTAIESMALGAQAKALGPVKFLQSDVIVGLESDPTCPVAQGAGLDIGAVESETLPFSKRVLRNGWNQGWDS